MKPFTIVLMVVLSFGFTHAYSLYGSKRFNRAPVAEPVMPVYSQQQQPHYLQPQYMSVPYRVADDYNRIPSQNPNYFYYPRQEYQTPLYGIPTFRGDYQPKPYSFAQPSYNIDDRIETTNPLDYLHEEILQENERERSMNNAAFMQNLALYNKQVDSLKGRQQQIQQIQDFYNLRGENDPEDYDIEQPTDWYDRTAILVDPNSFDTYQQPQQYSSDYNDEMEKELRDLKKHSRKSSISPKGYDMEWQTDLSHDDDWQRDMPSGNDDVPEEDYNDDDWINWGGQKRNIQPKKVSLDVATTTTPRPTDSSKIIAKLHKDGQKEVVLPRPATPVRKPFTESVMKMMKANEKPDAKPVKAEKTPPIYKTIKEIIDMEQNLSHLSNNEIPTSKIRKRFVSNEEALAQQLNGLKRSK